jgi:hypothetical protein
MKNKRKNQIIDAVFGGIIGGAIVAIVLCFLYFYSLTL